MNMHSRQTLVQRIAARGVNVACVILGFGVIGAAIVRAKDVKAISPPVRFVDVPSGLQQDMPRIAQLNPAVATNRPAAVAPSVALAKTPAAKNSPAKIIATHSPRIILMNVTAYCADAECCGPDARGITASGKPVSYNAGHFAAAPRSLPFGTHLRVPGYNNNEPIEVIDRGGAIIGNHLDVFFPTHEAAKAWGRQMLAVEVE